MSININSEAWCRKAYLNYHCYGNSMNISADEMGEITKAWSSKLTSWQATVSNDENQYEFDDSDYSSYKDNGKKAAQDQTGYENSTGDKAKQISRTTGDMAFAAGSATLGIVSAAKSGINIGKNIAAIGKFGKGGTALTKNVGSATKAANAGNGAAKTCAIVGASLAIATATMYRVMKPNKTQKEACDELQNVMANNQAALSETQADMENMANEIIDLSDQANEANEEANDNIEEQKTEYDMYKASYEALKAKAESGEPLTEEEKALYQELIKYMTETGENITETQENTTDVVGNLYDDIGTYQEGYDYAAETMGEVEGSTDYAASVDATTRDQCYTEAVSQGLNAVGGAVSGAQLLGSGPWFWALGAASIAAGISSGFASAEQISMAGEVGTEIDMRKDTQNFNTETMDMYDEEIDAYDGFMTGVEDLELEIPDDVAAPEDTALPPTTGDGLPTGTPEPIKPDKKEEETAK
ncbi:MAG: YkyA family protein [Candidatus Gastranaerophilales bacterium]|nr:YkyA family protein [Candidatus Gastranaerophilales bacterium]MCM1072190.1 YkyA family protein [Bacteroides sp.]